MLSRESDGQPPFLLEQTQSTFISHQTYASSEILINTHEIEKESKFEIQKSKKSYLKITKP